MSGLPTFEELMNVAPSPEKKEPLRVITQEESWKQEVHKEIVELLEDWLERAKTGQFDGIALIGTNKDGSCTHSWSRSESFSRMLGAIHRLAYRFNVSMDDE